MPRRCRLSTRNHPRPRRHRSPRSPCPPGHHGHDMPITEMNVLLSKIETESNMHLSRIKNINKRLSGLKIYLRDCNLKKYKLEQQLNLKKNKLEQRNIYLNYCNKNDQSTDNLREYILNQHNKILINKQQLDQIQIEINSINKKITETHERIASGERMIITINKEEEKCIKEKKNLYEVNDELNPIITMFNSRILDLNLLFKIRLETAILIKNDSIDNILFHYNSLKKCLNETFNPSLVEPICNHFISKYHIKNLISYINNNKVIKIFLDLIIFIRPDIDEQKEYDFQKQQKEEENLAWNYDTKQDFQKQQKEEEYLGWYHNLKRL